MAEQEPHWLTRKETIRKLWIGFALVLAAVVALGFLLVESHPHFGLDDSRYAFYAWYGFLTCVGFVLFSKLLGLLIKRPDDYYDD